MQQRSTPLKTAQLESSSPITQGPSEETICMLQLLARTYRPKHLENSWLDKHSLT